MAAEVSVTIAAPPLEPVTLTGDPRADGLYIDTFDITGAPRRSVSTPNPGADGVFNATKFVGQRTITLGLKGVGVTEDELDAIGRLVSADVRSTITIDGWLQWPTVMAAECVGVTFEQPVDKSDHAAGIVTDVVQFEVPGGWLESVDLKTEPMRPASGADEEGLLFPIVFPILFHTGTGPTDENLTVKPGGRGRVRPQIELHGGMEGPRIENELTGQVLHFPELVIPVGERVLIDCKSGRVRVAGNGPSRLGFSTGLDPARFRLEPGVTQTLLFTADAFDDDARGLVSWRPTY